MPTDDVGVRDVPFRKAEYKVNYFLKTVVELQQGEVTPGGREHTQNPTQGTRHSPHVPRLGVHSSPRRPGRGPRSQDGHPLGLIVQGRRCSRPARRVSFNCPRTAPPRTATPRTLRPLPCSPEPEPTQGPQRARAGTRAQCSLTSAPFHVVSRVTARTGP